MHRQLEGTVEADDLYHTAGNKDQAAQGGKKALGRRAHGRRQPGALAPTAGEAARIPATIIDNDKSFLYTHQASVFATTRGQSSPAV